MSTATASTRWSTTTSLTRRANVPPPSRPRQPPRPRILRCPMATCRSDRAVVYVLCFERPFHGANGRHPGARHYIGIAPDGDVQRRLAEHLSGHGSPLVRAVVAAGIGVD